MIRRIFPNGTNGTVRREELTDADIQRWSEPPDWPPDVFAATAWLLETSGAFGFFSAERSAESGDGAKGFVITEGRRKELETIAEKFESGPAAVDRENDYTVEAGRLWQMLLDCHEWPVNCRAYMRFECEAEWWTPAFELMLLTDEVVGPLGYSNPPNCLTDFQEHLIQKHFNYIAEQAAVEGDGVRISGYFPTITENADPDVVCVQPKGRVPSIGCTTRAFSRNMSLLKPRGHVRCNWFAPPDTIPDEDERALDILLVPAPFKMTPKNFEQVKARSASGARRSWRSFEIQQDWLDDPETVLDPFRRMLKALKAADREIQGVVFPEYALDYVTFERACEVALNEFPDLEFVIAGTSKNCDGKRGNWVVTRHYQQLLEEEKPIAVTTSRGKHHRWRLDRKQLESYGLTKQLPPAADWWENLNLGPREVHVHPFRQSSAYTVLICEDLARSDPCHEVVRSMGPELVFVLLMDGPQLSSRWAARAASGLAEDPGSSVLTFTCLGLVDLSNAERAATTGKPPNEPIVACWRDETGAVYEIPCSPESPGLVLSLIGERRQEETTIDGRKNARARRWTWDGRLHAFDADLNLESRSLKGE